MDPQRGLFQGVPAYWAPGPGPLVGAINFRVGFIDENLFQRGLSHLIEHLALAELNVDYQYNGQTEIAKTSFFARGSELEVSAFLEHVVNALASLPWDRLETEASVLNAEAAQRGSSLIGTAAWSTYGPAHLGLIDQMELAHDRLDQAEIDQWRRTYFTRENCTLWFSGPKPAPLNLEALPAGARMESPKPQRIIPAKQHQTYRDIQSPAAFTSTERSFELGVGLGILGRRINDRLRNDLGAAYGAQCNSLHYSADSSFLMLSSQASPKDSVMVYEECAYEISKLAYDGCTDEELDWNYQQFLRAAQDPAVGGALAEDSATNELLGAPVYTAQERATRLKALDKTAIGNAIAEMNETLLWVLPHCDGISDRRPAELPHHSVERVKAKKFHRAKGATKEERRQRLMIAPEGITYIDDAGDPNGYESTILVDTIVGGFRTKDSRFIFWAADGRTTLITPADWDSPDRATEAAAALLPPEKLVHERDFEVKERTRFNYAEATA